MSTILDSPNLQIYNNATFIESLPLQPITENSPNFEDFENREPNESFRQLKKPATIDEEITETEKEIARLSKKLELLKIKKSKQTESKTPFAAKRGRIVPAKFLTIETPGSKKSQQSKRRGFSLGPADIYTDTTLLRSTVSQEEKAKDKRLATPGSKKIDQGRSREFSLGPRDVCGNATSANAQKNNAIKGDNDKGKNSATLKRRGMSIGPMEIQRLAKNIQEKKVRNVCMTTSPKSRKTATKSNVSNLRNGIATVGAKRSSKIDGGLIMGVRPKALFEEKKRPLNTTKYRIVPSRYSLAFANNEEGSKRRKWSLPEDDDKESKKNEARRKRCLSLGGANLKEMSVEMSSSPKSVEFPLLKIRTQRCVDESPRDSGSAKRVADLVGKKCVFDELELGSSCQSLDFEGYDQ